MEPCQGCRLQLQLGADFQKMAHPSWGPSSDVPEMKHQTQLAKEPCYGLGAQAPWKKQWQTPMKKGKK